MTPEQQPPQNQQPILDAIKQQGVTMHSRRYFRARHWLALLAAILMGAIVIWHYSVVFFGVTHSGRWYLTGFGTPGWRQFFLSLPWLLIIIGIVFIVIFFQVLIRGTKFYRLPTVAGTAILLVVTALGACLVATTPFHLNMHRNTAAKFFPFLTSVYKNIADREPAHIVSGTVIDIGSQQFTLVDRHGNRVVITTTEETDYRTGYQPRVGDAVEVLGDRDDGQFHSLSIKRLPNSYYCEITETNDNVGGCR